MKILQAMKSFFELRNVARAVVVKEQRMPRPIYSSWSLKKAVAEGYKQNSWVYRSVFLKSQASGAVPWLVKNKDGETVDGHSISQLLKKPNPHISRQDIFELISLWMELGGSASLLKAQSGQKTYELWPISPDRLHPIPSSDPQKWMEGFALDKSKTVTYEPEKVIHFKYMNPADPLIGISPLEVLAKTIDVDNSQRDFNKATSQNRGVVDGVFVFKRGFRDQAESDVVRDAINERYSGKRTFGVLGDEASFIRTALTPAEMDFIASRKANREEIFICFGVPPVYAGVMDGATMNNYKTSELVFWFGTMLFFLDNLKDTLNFSLADELGEGLYIDYDISNIPAIREAMLARTKTAKILYEMGVPFEQLNKVFKFGFSEFPGWEKSIPSSNNNSEQINTDSETRSATNLVLEFRANAEDNRQAIENEAVKNAKIIADLLETQQEAAFDALNTSVNADIKKAIDGTKSLWIERLKTMYIEAGSEYGLDFPLEVRAAEDDVKKAIEEYLANEKIILTEVSLICETTVEKILEHVNSTIESGASVNDLQQAIIDTGIFDAKRALGLARTISGNAVNLGQWKGAEAAGATHKSWSTASFEVRETHQEANGQTVKIDEDFIVGRHKARFPLDNQLPPEERMNCRCTLTYSIRDLEVA